ncbi:hypothetical protein [Nonomuraea candida]|uniref:hypothetical protein n=1 Tax=Nonomuraea candida TaxID=359159 RepID=UPI0005BDEEC9|nr:hypothetical protein [Nonomuraea candida]
MSDGQDLTTGRCYVCKRTFTFDPKQVETVLIDPETRLPPGFSVLGTLRPAGPEAVGRSADEPICPECVDRTRRLWETHNPPPPRWESWPPAGD